MNRLFTYIRFSVVSILLSYSGISLAAETLSAYVQACKQELELNTIPGYKCTDGINIPSLTDRPGLFSTNNYIGKVETGNPNVTAMFLCRNVANNKAALNGYILQNKISGKTCFFDAIQNQSSSQTLPALDSSSAGNVWRQPGDLVDRCVNCHTADPFIVTPALANAFSQLQLMYNGRNLKNYKVVNTNTSGSHFFGWENLVNNAINANTNNCATACHRLAANVPGSSFNSKIVTDAQQNTWMPPDVMSGYHVTDPFMYNNFYRLQNYWALDWYVHIENGPVEATNINFNWQSANWTFEKVGNFYRIKNRWKPNEFLHVEYGSLQAGVIQSGWLSAQWELVKYTGTVPSAMQGKVYLIRNRWKANEYINVEGGSLKSSPINTEWHSARWILNKI